MFRKPTAAKGKKLWLAGYDGKPFKSKEAKHKELVELHWLFSSYCATFKSWVFLMNLSGGNEIVNSKYLAI